MEGLELADYFDGSQDTIYVLVGSDFYWDIVIGDIVSGDGPTAISNKLGCLLSGPVKGATTDNYVVSNLIVFGELPMRETDEVTEIMQRFWETESIGIEDTPKCQMVTFMRLGFLRKMTVNYPQTIGKCAKHVLSSYTSN